MKDFQPLVSIIIPVFNGSDYLREAINSAIGQTYHNVEIIVVNDGSTDDTEQIALSYGERIRYFTKENGGTSTALNLGIENMRGEYFSWLSHDDQYYPKKIEREVESLCELTDKNTVMLCNWDVINADYERIDVRLCDRVAKEYPSRESSRMFPILYANIHGCAMLIPKACFDEVGVFDVDLRVAHDFEFFRRILKKFPHKLIPEVLVIARDGANRQGKYANTRCNVEYSLLLIDIIDNLTEEEILEMMPDKRSFYMYLKDMYYLCGFTIASEYMRVVSQSLGYLKENVVSIDTINTGAELTETTPSHTPDFPRTIFGRFFRALKIYGFKGTMRKIVNKFMPKT